MKKAQGMPMETIIISIIVILVLIVLVFIFIGKFNIFGKTTKSCSSQGGVCTSVYDDVKCTLLGCSCGSDMVYVSNTDCEGTEKELTKVTSICCINVAG